MRSGGKIVAIWGLVLPLATYPWARGFHPQAGLIGSVPHMYFYVLESKFPYALVVLVGLWMVGLGLTADAMWVAHDRELLLRALMRLADRKAEALRASERDGGGPV